MKKIILVMALLMLAGPALAAVTITADCNGFGEPNQCVVRYVATGNDVRAFALDITISDGNIVSVDDEDLNYYVNPGSVSVDGDTITGDLVCDAGEYAGTKAGLNTGEITTEQGSLYVGDANSPGGTGAGSSGVLFSFKVDTSCTVDIELNTIRGGVVMEDPDEDPVLTIVDGCALVAPPTGPACWACPFWALGDINGDGYVTAGDVGPIINYFGQTTSAYPCADLNQDGFITAGDVGPIINNFGAGDGVPCP
jgi:hypothetical protein